MLFNEDDLEGNGDGHLDMLSHKYFTLIYWGKPWKTSGELETWLRFESGTYSEYKSTVLLVP
jgi:hypothetical protein